MVGHKHDAGDIFPRDIAMDNDVDIEYCQQLPAPQAYPPLAPSGADLGQDDAGNKEAIQDMYGHADTAKNSSYLGRVSVVQIYPDYLKKCAA